MKAAVEAFKKQFTGGFIHNSPSPNIKAFDPSKGDRAFPTEGVTFGTRDADFADSFFGMHRNKSGGFDYDKGSTSYPISINLGKHFVPGSKEGSELIDQYISKILPNPDTALSASKRAAALKAGAWDVMEDPSFLQHLKDTGHDTFTVMEGGVPNVGVFDPKNIRGKFAKYNPEDADSPDFMKAEGGAVDGYAPGGKVGVLNEIAKLARHPHGQHPKVAQALEEYLKGNISQEERIRIMNQYLPMRQWKELPPNYTDDEIRNALTSDKQSKALAPVPVGMRVGNRLDIPAYTRQGVYVDTTHDAATGKPISYGRTGHLKNVEFYSSPDTFVRVGLGTKPQALTPMGATMGTDKTPKAQIKGIHQGTSDDEVRRMMEEMMQDPNYTQIGMDPRKHSQFYDKQTGMPVWAAEEKLQSGPLILAPKQGLETTTWDDPRLNLSDFEGKKYATGGKVGMLSELMQLIKQQGGSAAVKRLEKAADLVPNLENKFQPKALKSAFTADNASAVMVMKPGDFEKYAMPIDPTHKGYKLGDVYAGNHDELPKGDLDEYLNYLNSVKKSGGFSSVPFLNVGQREGHSFPNIQGHEGRHRMRALEKANEDNALVQMIPTPNLREPFPRRSQEEYLEALQNKIGIKPMITPEQTEEGVSRGLIELPEMFAPGGAVKAAKKMLEHARSVPFVHYSNKADLMHLDPNMYGTGIKGKEAARLKSAPDIRPRSYIYTDRPDVRPEVGLGSHKYSGVAEDMYPLHEDPAGYSAIAKTKAIDPYMMQFGREVIDQPTHLNELERLIKAAGYKGYANDDVGLLFHPIEVKKVTD
jgi:hypothetical protein